MGMSFAGIPTLELPRTMKRWVTLLLLTPTQTKLDLAFLLAAE